MMCWFAKHRLAIAQILSIWNIATVVSVWAVGWLALSYLHPSKCKTILEIGGAQAQLCRGMH